MIDKTCPVCKKVFRVSPTEAKRETHCSKQCRNDPQSRFWAKVCKTEGCWSWMAAKDKKTGYGRFQFRDHWKPAHRVAYILTYGEFPEDLEVMHQCDNPNCVRPDHLKLGTHLDNMKDMYSKGRRQCRFGENHHNAKLTQAQVDEIRNRYAKGSETFKGLGKEFGVTPAVIHRIVRGLAWTKGAGQ